VSKALFRMPWQWLWPGNPGPVEQAPPLPAQSRAPVKSFQLDIAPNDPLLAYFAAAPGVVEIDALELDSPALRSMKDAGVKLAVPLVSQGELIGLLNLGSRRSELEYSSDDRRLLDSLATQAAPALRVAQLARQQQIEARQRERVEQELRVARLIQQTLLPATTPDLDGWRIAAHWQPALAVSGDFYDFLPFPDGRLGIIVADVTGKGVPAALVMATARSLLRSAAERLVSPGQVLQRANDQICPDIPQKMFVTCLYILLDPHTGAFTFANAGHNLPIKRSRGQAADLRATGMPLGLLPGMTYEEQQACLEPGESLLLYSDGLVEAHDLQGDMFGFPRLRHLIAGHPNGESLIDFLIASLADFTGPDWEQEDDVTLVSLERTPGRARLNHCLGGVAGRGAEWHLLADFSLPSQPGNERQAMQQVAAAVAPLHLAEPILERLKTAVAETTMNAMEHGNCYQADRLARVQVLASPDRLAVWISDQGGERTIPAYVAPDLQAKLSGLQSPRGWGLFLIQNMVDEVNIHSDQDHHTVELIVYLEAQGS